MLADVESKINCLPYTINQQQLETTFYLALVYDSCPRVHLHLDAFFPFDSYDIHKTTLEGACV